MLEKNNFIQKKLNHYNLRKNILMKVSCLSGVELKEFSLLYLIMNNLDIFQENIHLIENIELFSEEK